MKVLVISHLYPNSRGTGHGIWVHRLARGCRALGHDVRVVNADRVSGRAYLPAHWVRAALDAFGAREHRESISEEVPSVHPSHCDHLGLPSALKHIPRLRAAWRGTREILRSGFVPEVIHAIGSYSSGAAALPIAKRLRIPMVVTEISSPYDLETRPEAKRKIAREALVRACSVVCITKYMERRVQAEFPEIAEKTRVVHLPTDDDFFRIERAAPVPPPFRAVSAGFLVQQKGFADLVDAVSMLESEGCPIVCDVLGDGPLREELKEQARAKGLRDVIRFHGHVAPDELGNVLSRAHFFILPSLHETQAVVLVEGMSAGLPAVYTRCGGPEEFMTEERGIGVPAGDAKGLAAGIRSMVENWHKYRPEMLRTSCQAEFGEAACAGKLAMIYEETQKSFSGAGA